MNQQQKGFTLIELIMVIVILGILAATALPKYVDMGADARKAAIQGIAGSVRAVSAMAHATALAQNKTGATATITMEGSTVNLVYGYVRYDDVDTALTDTTGFTITEDGAATPPTVTISNGASTAANCQIVYTQAADASTPASVAMTVTDCS